ncbi:Protein bride of sevenless [Lucilia cuprina]|uniref:Protein bride of sevenless n=1 Tax=Lucilia cuprina TaxID=7375 RepID=A0A0L0CP90_LUCCU|nr:Protein bride of sevenless [Lucilia cuprina]KNC34178.1 Protein bride of sevenless [Lucilia cuprina]
MFWKCRKIQIFGQKAMLILALLVCCLLTFTYADEATTTTTRIRNIPKITKSRAIALEKAKATTTTTTTTTPPPPTQAAIEETTTGINDICIHGITAVIGNSEEEETIIKTQNDLVQIIEGDIMISVITKDTISAMFVINRLNVANLLEANFEIGIRAIAIDSDRLVENLLLQEVEYQQQCLTHAVGIFIDFDYYNMLGDVIKELDYFIWPIPSTRADIFPKVAHLLYQMPWGDQIASVEILTENLNVYNDFMDAVRSEHMCLMHFKSDSNIYILFGNKLASHFKENGTVFAVPTERMDRHFIIDLPNKSFILMENEIDVHLVDKNATQVTLDEPLIGKTILPSRVLAFARPILELSHWLKSSLQKNCKRIDDFFVLETCNDFLTFIEDWEKPDYNLINHNTAELLDLLSMRKLATLMNFQMFQKFVDETRPGAPPGPIEFEEKITNLREIASQNFVTNITTYYHYNRDNQTSVELKTKFGHVFNCQYTSGGDNSRYPFLFDGESVMFWRIKPDTWVATGMTAAILGILCTLAILVFIVVRISLGDVFEGNPVTSILLLLSLLLMFTSFIPFSLEYVGEHRNSHVTFEDAATLNTLCAVRIFILTLVYCFVFSLLLCRAVMLASIGSEGGFLSHVNGYIQAVICVFSIMVQLVMSIQLLVVMHIASDKVSCENMYYGHWLLGLLSYDMLLLLSIIALVPFIYRSQRNYREGILIVIGAVLMFIIWIVFISLSMFGDDMRDAALPLGLQASGWAILVGILIPRTFLIVRGIERSDIAQALPSLTSLAFAQNNQYSSEQSVYECVNPAMRNITQDEHHNQTPSEIPTLPIRGNGPRRQQFFANLRQANAHIGPNRQGTTRVQRGSPNQSEQSSLEDDEDTPESSKITRF